MVTADFDQPSKGNVSSSGDVSLYEIVRDEIQGYSTNMMQLEQQKQVINNTLLSSNKDIRRI